ncbi:MAG: hypothetical protein QM754_03210 [Tepidisphaeraceae bacterium]
MPDMTAEKVDLTNCDREPIHIPGSVQPHGVLLVLDALQCVVSCSQNIEQHLGVAAGKAARATAVDAAGFRLFQRTAKPGRSQHPAPPAGVFEERSLGGRGQAVRRNCSRGQ